MKAYSQNSMTKRIFSGLLAVWMSGVCFLFCCGAPNVQAEAESCPLAKTNHCGKSHGAKASKNDNAPKFESLQNNGLAFDCCGFFPTIFSKERNVEKTNHIAELPATLEIASPALVFVKVKSKAFVACKSRTLNKSGTYLKNQVFRI